MNVFGTDAHECMCVYVCMCVCVFLLFQGALCTSSVAEQLRIYTCSFGEKGRIPLSDTDVSYQHETVGRDKHLSTYFQSLLEVLPTVIVL